MVDGKKGTCYDDGGCPVEMEDGSVLRCDCGGEYEVMSFHDDYVQLECPFCGQPMEAEIVSEK